MVGKRRMMVFCLVMLISGSVVAALATSLVPLIVGRALQGLSTGLIPLGISLMRDELPVMVLGGGAAIAALAIVAAIPPRAAVTTAHDAVDGPALLVRGTVRHEGGPAGRGAHRREHRRPPARHGRAADDGGFALARTGTGRAHLLVVQWSGIARAEPLAGTDGLVCDVELADRVPVPG